MEVAVLLVVEEVLVGRCLCVVDGPESWSVVSGRLRTLWELVGDQIVVTRSRSLVLVLRMCVWSKECIVNASMAVRSGWCSVVEVGVAVPWRRHWLGCARRLPRWLWCLGRR